MATTPANSASHKLDELVKWLVENAPCELQIARIWPFRGIDEGKTCDTPTPAK